MTDFFLEKNINFDKILWRYSYKNAKIACGLQKFFFIKLCLKSTW